MKNSKFMFTSVAALFASMTLLSSRLPAPPGVPTGYSYVFDRIDLVRVDSKGVYVGGHVTAPAPGGDSGISMPGADIQEGCLRAALYAKTTGDVFTFNFGGVDGNGCQVGLPKAHEGGGGGSGTSGPPPN